jgi:adenylate kinase
MRLILLGAPGAGKGTQGALLAEAYGLDRVVTGDILRQAVREGTELGREAKRYMDAGELVPDPLIIEMLKTVLARAENGFVMDGFPRTLEQARSFDHTLDEMGLELDAVLVLDAPEDVVVKRISGRRSCPQCGAVYNVHLDPPDEGGVCDRCGGTLTQRADDREETVLNRLRVYREETRPLIEHYRKAAVPVTTVDANRPVDEVQADLRGVLPVG